MVPVVRGRGGGGQKGTIEKRPVYVLPFFAEKKRKLIQNTHNSQYRTVFYSRRPKKSHAARGESFCRTCISQLVSSTATFAYRGMFGFDNEKVETFCLIVTRGGVPYTHFFCFCLPLCCANGNFSQENSGRFPQGKPAATESRYPTLTN